MPFNGIEQQKIILFLTVFSIVNIIYNITSYYVCASSYSEAEAIIKGLMKFDKMLSLVALSEKPRGSKRVIKCGSHVYNVWSHTLKSLLCRRSGSS